jgi:hypothetical protein
MPEKDNYASILRDKELSEKDVWRCYHDYHPVNTAARMRKGFKDKFLKKWKAWDGPFTKPGSYIDFSEVHPVQIAIGSVGLTYIMHEIFATIFFGMAFKALVDKYVRKNCQGLMCQIAEEMHYYLFSGLATAGFMEYLGYRLPTISINMVELMKIFIG